MKMLSGQLTERRYSWPNETAQQGGEPCQGMTETASSTVKENGVLYINDQLGLHRVCNASDSEVAVSLHLYCPPFSSCQAFDERTGRSMTCPVTFYSKFGHKLDHGKKK